MDKLRILHIIPSLAKGGAERLVLDICNELNKRTPVEVRLMLFRNYNEYNHLSKVINIDVVSASVIPSISRKNKIKLDDYVKYVNDFKPRIIHTHLFETEIIAREIIFPEIAYVSHLHDNMPQFENFSLQTLIRKRRLTNYYEKKWIIKKYRQCNNHFIAISKDTRSYFTKCLPDDLHRITLIHNAIDLKRFTGNIRINKLHKSNDVVKFVSTGSLVDKKNQIFLVDAVKILADKGLNIHLDILGEGINREKIQACINVRGLREKITLQGNVNNVEDYLLMADLYVHSAIAEPFGLVLLEAMAAGLPVVSLDGKGNRDIVINDFNGYLITKPDIELFTDKIIKVVTDKALYENLSKNAIAFAKKFDINDYCDKLINLYKSIL